MNVLKRIKTTWLIAFSGLIALACGLAMSSPVVAASGAAILSLCVAQAVGWGPPTRAPRANTPSDEAEPDEAEHVAPKEEFSDDPEHLAANMARQGRYALLLRPQVAANLSAEEVASARDELHDQMGLVPAGDVLIGEAEAYDGEDGPAALQHETAIDQAKGLLVRVDSYYLDRYSVTNRWFQHFVDDGGYEKISFWDPQIWPAVLDFVDRTGFPGPRNWENGRFRKGEAKLPVVGVSWFEASAYARWVGKRLATDAEWEKAGSWPVNLDDKARSQRRFPWGDSIDLVRCNLLGSGRGKVVAVDEFPDGVSVGGVYQLIGNVWEWTAGEFGKGAYPDRALELPQPMKSIRGGSFDTYFDAQATCQFRSGESPMSRKHNIGFRCAVSICDLVDTTSQQVLEQGADAEHREPALEEVTS